MLNSQLSYVARTSRQQRQRRKRRKTSLDILNNVGPHIQSSDDDMTMNSTAVHPINTDENSTHENNTHEYTTFDQGELLLSDYLNSKIAAYISESDDDNTDWNGNLVDSSLPLYENSRISVKAAATSIMSTAIEFNFPKFAIERILKVIKTPLPTPNLLLITFTSILKSFGATVATSSKFYCNSCLKLCTSRHGQRFCENEKCKLVNKAL